MKTIKHLIIILLISYSGIHATEVWKPEAKIMFEHDKQSIVSQETKTKSQEKYHWLNWLANDLFNTKQLQKPKVIRKSLLNPFGYAGKMILLKHENGDEIECTYFDRGKKDLIVIGAGFGNPREMVAPLIPFFIQKFDIVIFDQRGHGYDKQPFSIKKKLLEFLCWQRFPSINTNQTYLGNKEDEDVTNLVNFFKYKKHYEHVYGIGLCYSGMIFAKAEARAQEQGKKLFDKLILDSCLLSFKSVMEQVEKDPKLLFSPQRGGWKNHWLIQKAWVKKRINGWIGKLFQHVGDTSNLNTATYLKQLKQTPILFVHSKKDLMVPYKDFEKLWDSADKKNKAAIITTNSHLTNHLKMKELYALISNNFLSKPFEKFKGDLEYEAPSIIPIAPCPE